MHPTLIGIFTFAGGLVVGTIYGRKAEQKLVSTALEEVSKVDAASRTVVDRVHVRWEALRKAL